MIESHRSENVLHGAVDGLDALGPWSVRIDYINRYRIILAEQISIGTGELRCLMTASYIEESIVVTDQRDSYSADHYRCIEILVLVVDGHSAVCEVFFHIS